MKFLRLSSSFGSGVFFGGVGFPGTLGLAEGDPIDGFAVPTAGVLALGALVLLALGVPIGVEVGRGVPTIGATGFGSSGCPEDSIMFFCSGAEVC